MSDINPYQAPNANVVDSTQGGQLGEPQQRPVGSGWDWIASGFGLFKTSAGLWIGMIVVYFVILVVLSFIPLANLLVAIITPVFTAGFMVASKRADLEGAFEFNDLFAGFREQTGPLFILGLLYFGFSILIGIVVFGLMFSVGMGSGLMTGNPEDIQAAGAGMMIVVLLALALFIPLAMAMWFAPALVILNKLPPWAALKLSMKGCLKNILAFLLYGVILFVLGILAAIPLALGFLVLGPVVLASIYTGYKDIFIKGAF